jgi:hypothetical protein
VQTEASRGGCLGFDGIIQLVLREEFSARTCRRAIVATRLVGADAGCKMLSPGDGDGVNARGQRLCYMLLHR